MQRVLASLIIALLGFVSPATDAHACPLTNAIGQRALPWLADGHSVEILGRLTASTPSELPQSCTAFDRLAANLSAASARAPVVFVFGEVHDNPAHHALRALLIDHLADNASPSARPTIVFEHLGPEDHERLAGYAEDLDRNAPEAMSIFLRGDWWQQRGWPDQAMFAPIFATIAKHRLKMAAGNVARDRIRTIARGGLKSLTAEERSAYVIDNPSWSAAHQSALLEELEASHCGLMPRDVFQGLAIAQRARDGAMARALVASPPSSVLLTGNGHARRDRGVPAVAATLMPDRRVIAIAFIEVPPGTSPEQRRQLIPTGSDGAPAFDGVVFTTRVDRPDPCIAMRRAFEQRKK